MTIRLIIAAFAVALPTAASIATAYRIRRPRRVQWPLHLLADPDADLGDAWRDIAQAFPDYYEDNNPEGPDRD